MTYEETVKIMAMLSAFYGEGRGTARFMARAWHMVLSEFDYSDAERAVIEFAKNDKREYATFPAPGKLVEVIRNEQKKCNGLYNKLFNHVPYEQLETWEKAMISEVQYVRGLELTDDELREKRGDIINGFRKGQKRLGEKEGASHLLAD